MKPFNVFFLFVIVNWPGLVNAVEVKKIDLYLNSDMTIQNKAYARDITLNVYYIDSVKTIEHQISQTLPSDPKEAMRIMKLRITDPEFNRQVGKAYLPSLKAKQIGISRIPAAVINNQGVIYGSTDITKILTAAERVDP